MPDTPDNAQSDTVAQWYAGVRDNCHDQEDFHELGNGHCAFFVEGSSTLLVSFEQADALRRQDLDAPIGLTNAQESGYSVMCVLSEGQTWFRDATIYSFFDSLVDDGFFDEFDRVVFYGAGHCGYAAAAYSVAAPGATVLALHPQATLDPRVAEWDPRFSSNRRLSFTDRYGYAPDMLEAAKHAYIIYDPMEDYDAMHAALFTRRNVTKLRCPMFGDALDQDLDMMGILSDLLDACCEGAMNPMVYHRLFRARRDHRRYLRRLLRRLDEEDRKYLNYLLCSNVSERLGRGAFINRRDELAAQLGLNEDQPLPV